MIAAVILAFLGGGVIAALMIGPGMWIAWNAVDAAGAGSFESGYTQRARDVAAAVAESQARARAAHEAVYEAEYRKHCRAQA